MINNIFKNKNIWLFDLDNTLYSPKTGIFSQIDFRMKKFISNKLKISENEAFNIQKKFYKKYGSTLFGLMRNFNCDPEEFLRFVHDIDFRNLKKSVSLRKKIHFLPGKKILYTNGDADYAKKLLNALGLDGVFYDIFDIRRTNYIPKPKKQSFEKLVSLYDLKTSEVVYFDDLDKNLKTAFLNGVTTVHISEENESSNKMYVDFRFKTIINALDVIIKSLKIDNNNVRN